MKKIKLFFSAMLFLSVTFFVNGQSLPTHPKYIKEVDNGESFIDYFRDWKPGVPISEDENFYISRVKPKERFVNSKTQVNPDLTTDRKICMWVPVGNTDKEWGPMPRYVFDGDNFGLWSYVDIQGGWGINWVRVPGAYSDVCHKNGVDNGCLLFFDMGTGSTAQPIINMLIEKEGGEFKYSRKLVRFMKYYGVDGLGINPESYVDRASEFQDFLAECHEVAVEEGWHFKVYWYGTMNNDGRVNLGSSLSANQGNWFVKNGKKVTDMYMLNYNWNGSLGSSLNYAESVGGSRYNVYAGFDIQGRWLHSGEWSSGTGWSELTRTDASMVFWGAHAASQMYLNSTEMGSGDKAVMETYPVKQEQFFSGGNQNPANLPPVNDDISSSSINAMKKFHGIATYIPARSTLQTLPFVTRFGLGNGMVFRKEGKVTFDKKWYNISTQDYLPTWRWWITGADFKTVPDDQISCTFSFDDSWFAGSCLKLSGATKISNIRMFKTDFTIAKGDRITLRYKVNSGTETHLKLIWSKVGSENTFESVVIPAAAKQGEWAEFSSSANALKMNGNVACIGFAVENTNEDYEILLGEFAIVNNNKTQQPVAPMITLGKILDRRYNEIDFKVIYKLKDQNPSNPAEPIYNEDLDAWYFEIWSQPEDGEPTLCTTTTSWAAYVVGAPANAKTSKYRFGVRTVAPDGKTETDIVWSDYIEEQNVTTVQDLSIDKSIIKKNETFTITMEDPFLAEQIEYWSIVDPLTDDIISMGENEASFTTSIEKEGSFDVLVNMNDGSQIMVRGFVQISPDETGALPIIEDFTASPSSLEGGENQTHVTYSALRLGEGKVSRGLDLHDPQMFRLPENAISNMKSYSIALWFKADGFFHANMGTNLINRRYLACHWPHNNWGSFWVHIWPEQKDGSGNIVVNDNVISYTLWGTPDFPSRIINGVSDGNPHQVPNPYCTSDEYSVSLNTWNHLVICYNGTTQKMYLNGKKVAEANQGYREYQDLNGYLGSVEDKAPIYFGGSNVYHSGFNGTIDEVQVWDKSLSDAEVLDAMKGYAGREIPASLRGYWDFEEVQSDNSFANKGHGGDLKGTYIVFVGAAGENSDAATEEVMTPDNSVLGNPAISGSLEIKTKAVYDMPGASVVQDGKEATATYDADGKYDVTLTLENMWGKDTKTKTEYIVVSGLLNGIDKESIEMMNVYPNPFVDAVNIRFAKAGDFAVEIIAPNGACVSNRTLNVTEGETIRLSINGSTGMYLVRIIEDGVCVKTLKVNKK